MKKILIVISVVVTMLLFYFLLSNKQISYYFKQSFYSNAVVIVNNFQYEVLSGEYRVTNEMQYIMLDRIDANVSDNTFHPEMSYIAFVRKGDDIEYYLTLIGKGRYGRYAYKNTKYEDLDDFSNVVSSKENNTGELIKEISAKAY